MNFYGEELDFLKASLHTHSTTSDGRFTPEEIIALYRERGYGIFAFTDHRVTNPVSSLDGGGMLLLSGIELHPPGPRDIPRHILALGVPEDFRTSPEDDEKAVIAAVRAAGGVCFAAHPYWSTFTANEIMELTGVLGIEVYNTSTRYIGKAYNMQIWDTILDAGGMKCDAIAVDDTHRPCDLFRGWTMVGAREKTQPAVLEALRAGRYYATQGPEFTRLSFENGVFEAEFTPCAEAIVLTNRQGGFGLVDGEYTSIRYDASERPAGSYFRCQIRDAAGNFAWSNPVYL